MQIEKQSDEEGEREEIEKERDIENREREKERDRREREKKREKKGEKYNILLKVVMEVHNARIVYTFRVYVICYL